MSPFDLLVLVIVGLSGLYALSRGLVTELLSLLAWVGSLIVLRFGFSPLSGYMRGYIESGAIADIGTLMLLLIGSFALFRLAARWIGSEVRESLIGPLDRVAGAAFGVMRGLIIVSLGYMALGLFVERESMPDWIAEAKSRPAVEWAADKVSAFVRFAKDQRAQLDAAKTPPEEVAEKPDPGYTPDQREDMGDLIGKELPQ
jgi:membrane protein required for colicin V production